jgi:adenylyltransferase/sulfurtransferase
MSTTTSTQTKIHIPAPLRAFVGEARTVDVEAATAGEALRNLAARHPKLQPHLYDEAGKLRSYVNVYLNDEDIRYLDREETPLGAGDELSIVPSIAGGLPPSS